MWSSLRLAPIIVKHDRKHTLISGPSTSQLYYGFLKCMAWFVGIISWASLEHNNMWFVLAVFFPLKCGFIIASTNKFVILLVSQYKFYVAASLIAAYPPGSERLNIQSNQKITITRVLLSLSVTILIF